MKLRHVIWILLALVPLVGFADEVQSSAPSGIEKWVQYLDGLVAKIPANPAGPLVILLGFLVEALFRGIKSEKPRSLLNGLAKGLDGLTRMFAALAEVCRRLSTWLDRVGIQRLKDEPKPPEEPK